MSERENDSVVELSIRRTGGKCFVIAEHVGIEVSAENEAEALKAFASELHRVESVMAEKGFGITQVNKLGGGASGIESSRLASSVIHGALSPRRFSILWQAVIAVLIVLLGINQLMVVPTLDRMEKVAFYVFGDGGGDVGVRQIGRVAIDRIIDLAKATEEITPERREQLRRALRTIGQNSRPMIDALTSEDGADDGKGKGDAPSKPNGTGP